MATRKRVFSDVDAGASPSYWDDIRMMYDASASLNIPMGHGGAFHVALDGRANWHEGRWLLPGALIASWFSDCPEAHTGSGARVVVAVTEAVYQAVARHSAVLRILQAQVHQDQETCVIDTCSGRSVVAGTCISSSSAETVEVAEIFAGGFCGWSQGLRVLNSFGYQGRVKWLLDTAEDCFLGCRQVNPGTTPVFQQTELLEVWQSPEPTFICSSLEFGWWLQGPALTNPKIVCASAPCQPWSTGGSGPGLEDPDGLLLLHLFGQLAFLQTPFVILEQVAGFRQHRHFEIVEKAWTEAGYSEAWSEVMDILECTPVTRKRFLIVLKHRSATAPRLETDRPVLPLRPTIGSFDCILELPVGLHQACSLSPETLAIYLDAWYLPPTRHVHAKPQSPQGFRFRSLSDRATCFVAQYHFQHELSPRALETAGLYGTLLQLPKEVRFFSGAEIALMHGLVCPMWLDKDDRCQMKHMGNGLSPLHAVVPLALALQAVGPRSLQVSTAQALLQCLSMRYRASQVKFLEFREGWVLFREGEAFGALVEVFSSWVPRQRLPDAASLFGRLALCDAHDACQLVIAPDVSLPAMLAYLGTPAGFAGFFEEDAWANLEGFKIKCRDDLQGTVSFRIADALPKDPVHLGLDQLSGFSQVRAAAPPRFSLTGAVTLPFCKSFPVFNFLAQGWAVHLHPTVTEAAVRAGIHFTATRDCFRMPETRVLPTCAKHLLACLFDEIEHIACKDDSLRVSCKLQVEGRTFWQGLLPAGLEFEELADLWDAAHEALRVIAPARVYSGPKPVPSALTLLQARRGPVPPGFVNKAGWLLISYMPETRGGGAKDIKYQSAQTEVAQLLLEQGLSLSQTTAVVDRLLPLAGVPRLQRILDLSDAPNRWLQLQALCKQFSVSLPDTTSRSSRASTSTALEAQRRKAKAAPSPTASDFALQPGYFRNVDDSPAAVLTQLMPGASGVYLCDAAEAPRLLQDWSGTSADELGLVILGHCCPQPSTCQGSCGIPATTAAGHQVLLHACWHNLGKTPLHAKCDKDATVTLPEAACVCVTAFQDDFTAGDWQGLTANPVRIISERLKASGSTVVLEAPWGRSFRKGNRATAPAECESVQFHCRVQAADLLQLLRYSGHAQVYLTPKTWQGDIAKGYAVVWAAGEKDEVMRQSLQVPDPLGIVRSKKRFGIRVAEANFEAAWNIVRPHQDAPPKVEVTGLFKLLSAPPQVRASDIQNWARQMSWEVRPLRCLGPGQWLLGAASPPPEGLLSMNKQTVLVQAVAPRQPQRPVVRAGRAPRPSAATVNNTAETEDPLALNDPSKSYLASAGRPLPTGNPVSGPRQAEPPNQQRFDQQESRLQKLEAGLDEVRRGHTAMAQQLATTQTVVEQQVEQVQGELNSFARDFRQQLQANAEQQRQAQTAHQQQMQTGIDEIKAMLVAGRPTGQKRPAALPEMGDAQQLGDGTILVPGDFARIPVRLQFFLWFIGYRFGEAKNPGPRSQSGSLTLAVVNPTTILDKEWHINRVGADVLFASETSANAQVQQIMNHKFRGLGYSCLWGHPTETRHHTSSGRAMLRSYALGVAVFSKLPSRPAVQPLPDAMSLSCRISEGFVRFHCMEVKVISVYGVPRCLPDAAQRNNLLLAWAFQRATISCVPAVVAGDFNTCPTDLPSWQAFSGLGWVELGAFAAQVLDLHLPCTCKGATRFDTFLLPPSLSQFIVSADVLTDEHLFDSHAPMRLHLRMPEASPHKWIWPMPRTFQGLLQTTSSFETSYRQLSVTASKSYVAYHAPILGVAGPLYRVQAAPPLLPRRGRHGDPEPFDEDTSVLGRQRLRQLRRLTTYGRGLARFLRGTHQGPKTADGWPLSLDKEWAAISRAAGYGRCFARWVLQWPCFTHFPLSRPTTDFVADLTSFVRFDVEAHQRQTVNVKSKLFKFKLQVDAQEFGGSRSFVRVRAPEKPPFICVFQQSLQPAWVQQRHSHQLWTFQVQDPSKFELYGQVAYAQVKGQVTRVCDNLVTVLFPSDEDAVLPLSGSLSRSFHDTSWFGVVGSLMEFWSPIWNRDSTSASEDIQDWPQYLHLVRMLQSPCPALDVDLLDVEAWLHVARKLSPKKAAGPCGWHNHDLKLLPQEAVADLAQIMHGYLATGFPADIMRARVAVLSKVANPDSAAQARPITVLSCLFRFWARVLCTQVLATWSHRLPASIVGCLRGRSALDLSYSIQALVEDSLINSTDLSGFCLDLRKAFNFLPRAPLSDLLQRLGVPPAIAECWRKSLSRVSRCFQVRGSLGPPLGSSTGAPEGDPTSVLGMIAVCWMFVSLLQGLVEPKAYVDNLSWSSDAPDNHAPAILVLQDFVSSLRLEIDWKKTYQWATSPTSRRWWQQVGSALLPAGHGLQLVSHVKELGSYHQFCRRGSATAFNDRIEEAHARLTKLGTDPQCLATRSLVVQNGVWPFLFFGTEALLPSATAIGRLRGSAARALVGPHHTLSAHAALCLLPTVQDPEVYLLCHHIGQLKRASRLSPTTARLIWHHLLHSPTSARTVCGPAGALQVLLHRMGWTCAPDGNFKGPLHCHFHIHNNTMQQIRCSIEQAWADNMQDQILHRNGLHQAPAPHVSLTHKVFQKFRSWEQHFLARHFCGAFMSGAEKQTWSRLEVDNCPLCGELDTKAHRLFSCSALQSKRLPHADPLEQVRTQKAHWVHMPYASWPFEASVLQLLLAQLRLPPPAPPCTKASVTLLTDASALHSTCPTARITAWSVVVGQCPAAAPDLSQEDVQPERLLTDFAVLAQGCTPGQQTVPRAELAAIVWVCHWLAATPALRQCSTPIANQLWIFSTSGSAMVGLL
ncbi:unnamed protein product [Symbiodinium sp. CCMP2592]|nr:unnamed protein product [Symbiodinium sp. CCMP2592]